MRNVHWKFCLDQWTLEGWVVFRHHHFLFWWLIYGCLISTRTGEKTVADKVYRGKPNIIDLPDEGSENHQAYIERYKVLSQCNMYLKQFWYLGQHFRHIIVLNYDCFKAVAVLTKLSLENGKPLWDIFV